MDGGKEIISFIKNYQYNTHTKQSDETKTKQNEKYEKQIKKSFSGI